MDVWQITVAVLRRWYIFLPLMAVTGFVALQAGEGAEPSYEVSATAILVPGAESTEIESPYGSLDETNQVLSIVLEGPEARDSIEALGLTSGYEMDARSRSRIMEFTVVSDTPGAGVATGEAVLDLARQELAERQEAVGIPENAQVNLQVLQSPSVSEVVAEGKLRSMAIVGIVGAALAVLVAVLFDDLVGLIKRWLTERRDRREARAAAAQKQDGAVSDESGAASKSGGQARDPDDDAVTDKATRHGEDVGPGELGIESGADPDASPTQDDSNAFTTS